MLHMLVNETVGKGIMMAAPVQGRPRTFDESAVLDKALELFWRNGYRATTTRDLESALGLSQSSIYNAFASKRDLLIAALDRYEHEINHDVLQPLEVSESGLAAIDAFFDDLTHWVTHGGRRGCMIINLMAEDGGDDDELTQRTRAYRKRVRMALRNAIRRAAASGETSSDDIDGRADLLFGIVLGLNIAARGGASPSEIDALLASAHGAVDRWRSPSPSRLPAEPEDHDSGQPARSRPRRSARRSALR